MLEASGHTTGLSVQTDPGSALPVSHQLPLLEEPQTGLCESGRLRAGELGSTRTPTHCSARDTFRSHPPHTALLCAPNLPHHPKARKKKKKNCFPDCLAEA